MKIFDASKFCNDLIEARGDESQNDFAEKLGIKRPTLSLLENGRQLPTLAILSSVCDIIHKTTDEYFIDSTEDSLVYLMGSLEQSDKVKIERMAEQINIKEKYERLAKRGKHVID